MEYYKVADMTFNFELIQIGDECHTGYCIYMQVKNWLDSMPDGRWSNWVLGNHDRSRVGTRMEVNDGRSNTKIVICKSIVIDVVKCDNKYPDIM